jgi:hypothetical protein
MERLELLRIPSHGNISLSLSASEPTLSEIALVLAYAYETVIDLYVKDTTMPGKSLSLSLHLSIYLSIYLSISFFLFNPPLSIAHYEHAYRLISRSLHFYWLLFSLLFTEDLYSTDRERASAESERDREIEREKELRRHLKMISMLLRKKYAVVLVKLAGMIQGDVIPIGLESISGLESEGREREGLQMPSMTIEDLNDCPLLAEVQV